jgi:hypothetical protein
VAEGDATTKWLAAVSGGGAPVTQPCAQVAVVGCDPDVYPPNVIQNFMNSCTATGGSQSYCSCAITQIQKRYTLSALHKYRTGVSRDGHCGLEHDEHHGEVQRLLGRNSRPDE